MFPQLRCRVNEEGEERFSLKRYSWQAGLYTVGASISAQSVMARVPRYNICELCTHFCHMDHEHWMSSGSLEAWLLARSL